MKVKKSKRKRGKNYGNNNDIKSWNESNTRTIQLQFIFIARYCIIIHVSFYSYFSLFSLFFLIYIVRGFMKIFVENGAAETWFFHCWVNSQDFQNSRQISISRTTVASAWKIKEKWWKNWRKFPIHIFHLKKKVFHNKMIKIYM